MELPKTVLYGALADHFLWKKQLAELLTGRRAAAKALPSIQECGLGKWFGAFERSGFKGHSDFESLKEPHQRVHEHADRAADFLDKGDRIAALEEFDKVEEASREIIAILEKMIDVAEF